MGEEEGECVEGFGGGGGGGNEGRCRGKVVERK